MDGNIELLNFIYQNSQMGIITIDQLKDLIKDKLFLNHLQSQYNEYKAINNEALRFLHENGYDEKGINAFKKIRTYLMINIQTLTDKSTSHISEMLIIGSNMGIINAIKNLNKYKNADINILHIMERLLILEEDNILELKKFL